MWTGRCKGLTHNRERSQRASGQPVDRGAGQWTAWGRPTPTHYPCTVRPQLINRLCTTAPAARPRLEAER